MKIAKFIFLLQKPIAILWTDCGQFKLSSIRYYVTQASNFPIVSEYVVNFVVKRNIN
jgi:hypothetical protein